MLTSPQREKLKQAKVGNAVDRISNLPDTILTLILSFVSTKDAIKTSTLSTRWKSIWASIPTLNLDNYDFHSIPLFLNFVDKALSNQRIPFLEKVSIRCLCYDPPPPIESWINAAIEHNVCDLKIAYRYLVPIDQYVYDLEPIYRYVDPSR